MVLPYIHTHKIKLNEDKTDCITFTKQQNNIRVTKPLNINATDIKATTSLKYLGVTLDRRPTMHKHVEGLLRNGNAAFRTMYPWLGPRSQLARETKVLLYKTMIRPAMTYGAPLFAGASKILLLKLHRLQNKIRRHIANVDRYVRIRRLHEVLEIEYLETHVAKLTEKFYRHTIHATPLTSNMADARANTDPGFKHDRLHGKTSLYLE